MMESYDAREEIFVANKSFDAIEIDETNKLIKVHFYSDQKSSVFGKFLESGNSLIQANRELNKNIFSSLSKKQPKYKSLINKESKILTYDEIVGYDLKVESDKKDVNHPDLFNEIAQVVAGRQVANLASGMYKKIMKVNITFLALEINIIGNESLPVIYINNIRPVQINTDEYHVAINKIKSITTFLDRLVDHYDDIEFKPSFENDLFEIDESNKLIKIKYKVVNSFGIQNEKHEIIHFSNITGYKIKVDSEEMNEASSLISTKNITKAAGKVNPLFGKMMKTVNAVSNLVPQEKESTITKIRQVYLNIHTDILAKPILKIVLFDDDIGINSDSRQYHDINSKLEEVTCLLDRIMTMDGKGSSNDFASKDNLSDSGKMKKESMGIDKFEEIKY